MCVCVCIHKQTRRHAHIHTHSVHCSFSVQAIEVLFFLIWFYFQSYCSFSVQAVEALTAAGVELQVIECDKEVRGIEMQVSPYICPYICP